MLAVMRFCSAGFGDSEAVFSVLACGQEIVDGLQPPREHFETKATLVAILASETPGTLMSKHSKPEESLKGWAAIAKFLGQPVSTVQRWGNEGMPLTRIGRYVAASPAELERWLTREAGEKQTVHIPVRKHRLAGRPETRSVGGSQIPSQEFHFLTGVP